MVVCLETETWIIGKGGAKREGVNWVEEELQELLVCILV
jgi:hypothetical protein